MVSGKILDVVVPTARYPPVGEITYPSVEVENFSFVFEIVIAPVAAETEIPEPARSDVTPVLVTTPFVYVRPVENVVVAPE